jgi:hypothetical protein
MRLLVLEVGSNDAVLSSRPAVRLLSRHSYGRGLYDSQAETKPDPDPWKASLWSLARHQTRLPIIIVLGRCRVTTTMRESPPASSGTPSKLCRSGSDVADFAKTVLSARLWTEDLVVPLSSVPSAPSPQSLASNAGECKHPASASCARLWRKAQQQQQQQHRNFGIMGLTIAASALATVSFLSADVSSTRCSLLGGVGSGGVGGVLTDRNSSSSSTRPHHYQHNPDVWTCPSSPSMKRQDSTEEGTRAGRNHEGSFDEYLGPVRDQRAHLQSFLQSYRNTTYDAWGLTYEQVLEGMRNWKEQFVVPHVTSGDALFESACGIGLNLVLTAEVLHRHGVDHLQLFGNEVLKESADLANLVLPALMPQFGSSPTSTVCPGDSTNLSHVPTSSMDLVFCGYMSELYDPLGFYDNSTYMDEDEARRRHKSLCRAPDGDWRSQALLKRAMGRLDSWHGAWVGEMVRIARPGKAVVVEQVRDGRCRGHLSSFTGISREWWPKAIEKFGWDVDVQSLRFQDDTLFHNRYHVFMRKNGA